MKYRLIPINNQSLPLHVSTDDLKGMSNIQLEDEYVKLKEWLTGHESKTGTRNMFDVMGRSYDPQEYEDKLHRLEAVYDEGRRRELVYFMTYEEIEAIFSSVGTSGQTPTPTSSTNNPVQNL